MTIRKSSDWLCARAGDEVMMMNAAAGTYLGLNAMGARIWDLLDTVPDEAALCDALCAEFAVEPDTCRAEVDSFLAELDRHRAIERIG